MFIEPLKKEDLKEITDIEESLIETPWRLEDFDYELNQNPFAHLFVLKDQQQIFGYVDLWIMYEQAQISTIGVRRDKQSQGFGQQLLSYAMKIAEQSGVEVMSLEVRQSNQHAIALYKKNGFQIQSIRKNYYQDNHEDAYLMVKEMEGKR